MTAGPVLPGTTPARLVRALVGVAAALVFGAWLPSAAQAWQLTIQMHGGGTVKEITPRNLYGDGCTSSSNRASAEYDRDCVAGTPTGVYSSGDVVHIQASVPASYAAQGWRFSHWISNNGSGRVNCDGVENGANQNFDNPCKFQIFANLSMGAVFVDEGTPDTDPIGGSPDEGSRTNVQNGSFTFSSPDPTATLQCSWDDVNWSGCEGNPALAEGSHTLRARAVDPSNHADASPSLRSFTIDRTPPQTAINSQPPGLTTSKTASFSFGSSYGGGPPEAFGGFQCRLDDAADYSDCSSGSASYSNLGEGLHTFRVRAFDTAGNADASPATYQWTVDSVAPDTAITSGPSGSTESTSATFEFFSEQNATFECSLDSAGFSSCPSSYTINNLGVGEHTLSVRARDTAGNVDQTPAARTWTVTAPPTTGGDTGGGATPGGDTPGSTPATVPGGKIDARVQTFWSRFGKRTRVGKLTVTGAPVGSTVTLTCKSKGKSCPFKRLKLSVRGSRLVLAGKFKKRKLPAKTVITIVVAKDGMVAKRFRYTTQAKKFPTVVVT